MNEIMIEEEIENKKEIVEVNEIEEEFTVLIEEEIKEVEMIEEYEIITDEEFETQLETIEYELKKKYLLKLRKRALKSRQKKRASQLLNKKNSLKQKLSR